MGSRRKSKNKQQAEEQEVVNRFALVVSGEQADIIVEALDLYARIHIGQMETIEDHLPTMMRESSESWNTIPVSKDVRDRVRGFLERASNALGFSFNSSFGIHHRAVEPKARIAFDIKQVLAHRLAWSRRPDGGITRNFQPVTATEPSVELAMVSEDTRPGPLPRAEAITA